MRKRCFGTTSAKRTGPRVSGSSRRSSSAAPRPTTSRRNSIRGVSGDPARQPRRRRPAHSGKCARANCRRFRVRKQDVSACGPGRGCSRVGLSPRRCTRGSPWRGRARARSGRGWRGAPCGGRASTARGSSRGWSGRLRSRSPPRKSPPPPPCTGSSPPCRRFRPAPASTGARVRRKGGPRARAAGGGARSPRGATFRRGRARAPPRGRSALACRVHNALEAERVRERSRGKDAQVGSVAVLEADLEAEARLAGALPRREDVRPGDVDADDRVRPKVAREVDVLRPEAAADVEKTRAVVDAAPGGEVADQVLGRAQVVAAIFPEAEVEVAPVAVAEAGGADRIERLDAPLVTLAGPGD